MIEQLLLHAIGDYVTQNSWMANNKTKFTIVGWISCLIHALIYGLPFLLICAPNQFALIFITHFFIDKFRLAVYWIKLVNWNWKSNNHGFSDNTPVWLSTWLLIIIDNTFYITINYLSIKFR